MNNTRFSENDRIFYSDGYRLGQSALEKGRNEEKLMETIQKLYQSIDALIDSLQNYAHKQGNPVACGKGCHWCCHQAVFANSYEIHYLCRHIKKHFSAARQKEVKLAAGEKNRKVSSMKEKEILQSKSACPLLHDGICSAYSARPMACRIYLSTNLKSCQEFYHHPENKENYPALLAFPQRAGQMMNEGFIAALKENGVSVAEFRIENGLEVALKNKKSMPF